MGDKEWTVADNGFSAVHTSGFSLQIEGSPRSPSAVHPGKTPAGMSNLDQVRLLRCGMEAIAEAAKKKAVRPASKPAVVVNKKSSNRPVLSLKKRASKEEAVS